MNFGNFFRNISIDKQDGAASNLFAASGRLLESVTTKTGSFVSDLSQKVDFANKLDTIKKYSSIEKLGQTVLGNTGPAGNQSFDNVQESVAVQPAMETYHRNQPTGGDLSDQDNVQSSLQSERRQGKPNNADIIENQNVSEQRMAAMKHVGMHQQSPRELNLLSQQLQEQDLLQGQKEPQRTFQTSTFAHLGSNAQDKLSFASHEFEQNTDTWEPQHTIEPRDCQSLLEPVPQTKTNLFEDQEVCGRDESLQRTGVEEIALERHKNPFNSEATFSAKTRQPHLPIKRQSTTPAAARPARPPPPRQTTESSSLTTNEPASSLTNEPTISTPRETPILIPFFEVTDSSSSIKKTSTGEIGYLTRLQCQEIVSAVDSMIADAIDEPLSESWKSNSHQESVFQDNEAQENNATHPVFQFDRQVYEKGETEGGFNADPQTMYQVSYPKEEYTNLEEELDKTQNEEVISGEEDAIEIPSGEQAKESVDTFDSNNDLMKEFLQEYVQGLIVGNEAALKEMNEDFKEKMFTSQGRELFSKVVEIEGIRTSGRLEENGLRMMLSRVVFVLTQCQSAEDFVPAKRMLTSSLVYHIEDPMKVDEKVFLFSYIKSQPIWHSLRFWNACFFQSVQETRAKLLDNDKCEAEVTKAVICQIKSYLNTMQVFNLHTTMRQEFLRKQGDLFNLSQDDVESIYMDIESATAE